jgi:hypothetical protein
VKKHEGRPFAIVGVNSDPDRKKAREVLAKEKITWRSFWDGGSPDGPIHGKWNVTVFPTMYLIDHRGLIVRRAGLDINGGQIGLDRKSQQVMEQKIKEAEVAARK